MSTEPRKPLKPLSPRQEKIAKFFIRPMTKLNTMVYRLSGGRLAGKWTHGEPMLLLTTIGRKSGEPRTVTLGRQDETHVEITDGLELGETYVAKNAFW